MTKEPTWELLQNSINKTCWVYDKETGKKIFDYGTFSHLAWKIMFQYPDGDLRLKKGEMKINHEEFIFDLHESSMGRYIVELFN